MMKVELTKEMLVNMVAGTDPDYPLMDNNYGRYSGSYDRWTWDKKRLTEATEEFLLEYYKKLTA
jgi:hypothetical protein